MKKILKKKKTAKKKTAAKVRPVAGAKPVKPASAMKRKQMAPYKLRLVEMKKELLRGVSLNEANGKEGDLEEVRDLADQASDSYDRELAFGLSEAERLRLNQVEEALSRIAAGSYGVCDGCKKSINASRLRALPFARLCIECKGREERGEI